MKTHMFSLWMLKDQKSGKFIHSARNSSSIDLREDPGKCRVYRRKSDAALSAKAIFTSYWNKDKCEPEIVEIEAFINE